MRAPSLCPTPAELLGWALRAARHPGRSMRYVLAVILVGGGAAAVLIGLALQPESA